MSNQFDFEVHQVLCGDTRMMHDHVFEELKTSIALEGILMPIRLWFDDEAEQWLIVDGRHRYRAAQDVDHPFHKSDFIRHTEGEEEMCNIVKAWNIRKGSTKSRNNTEKQRDADKAVEAFHPEQSIKWMCKHTGLSNTPIRAAIERSEGVCFSEKSTPTSVSPESASEEAKSIETAIKTPHSDDQLKEKVVKLATVNGKVNTKNRGLLGNYLNSELGKVLIERAPIKPMPVGFQRLVAKVGVLDLRVGFPNLQPLWVEDYAPKYKDSTRKDTAKGRALLERLDDLDRMSNECAGKIDFDAGQICNRIWRNLDQPKAEPEPTLAEVVPIGDHAEKPVLKWYGVTIKWWEFDSLTFEQADSMIQLVAHQHKEELTIADVAHRAKHGCKMTPEKRKTQVQNMAKHLRLGTCWWRSVAGDGVGQMIQSMAHAMDNNAEAPQGDLVPRKYNVR